METRQRLHNKSVILSEGEQEISFLKKTFAEPKSKDLTPIPGDARNEFDTLRTWPHRRFLRRRLKFSPISNDYPIYPI
jgi:hypothetical protein